MFAYIAGSPFVFIELLGVAPEHFGWIFGTNAFGLILVSQVNGRIVHRYGADRILRAANVVQAVACLALLVAAATGFCDQAHLTRAFKARLGVTPGVFRAAHHG